MVEKVACCVDLGSRNCCLERRQNNVMPKDGRCEVVSMFHLCDLGQNEEDR
jgi:hypothetical protein